MQLLGACPREPELLKPSSEQGKEVEGGSSSVSGGIFPSLLSPDSGEDHANLHWAGSDTQGHQS